MGTVGFILLGIFLGAVVILAAAVLLRAARCKAPPVAAVPPAINSERAARCAGHLAQMIRCATVTGAAGGEGVPSPFDELTALLAECYPKTFAALERVELPDALLLRWRGSAPPPQEGGPGALLLMAHSDVVPATGAWARPPFSGQVEGGKIWGRGAMDDKGALCAIFEAVEQLLAEGFTPPCDVYLSSSFNEETMGPGAVTVRDWLVEQGVKLDFVLDEGGAVVHPPLPGISGRFALLGIVEKGYANLRFTARSGGGHASIPPKNSPLARLAAFIDRVERRSPFKAAFNPTVRLVFQGLAPHAGFGLRLLLANLWLFGPLAARLLPRRSPQAAALLRTTIAFTMAQGSAAANVLPETASVTANLRFSMHQPMQPSLAVITALAARYGLETEVLYANDVFPAADTGSHAYGFLRACAGEIFPEAPAVPFIMLAGTDARHFATLSPCTLRFLPLVLSPAQLAGMHGLDESLDVDALARAVAYYELVLRRWQPPAGKAAGPC